MADFFYDNQIRKYMIQFARIFSNWYVTNGKDPLGNDIVYRVPIMYGDASRQSATIINNNSTNNIASAPLITYYVSGLEYEQSRLQDPTYIDKINIRQRKEDEQGNLTTLPGQAFTVERVMPAPYKLRMTVDFWTTNYEQKLQLVEQIGAIFNPSLELQSTDNYVDWASLTTVFQDGLNFSSRSIPQGSNSSIDIMSWKFSIPIWISMPARLRKLGVIQKIILSVHQKDIIGDIRDDDLLLGTRLKVTPFDYQALLTGNRIELLPSNTAPVLINGEVPTELPSDLSWSAFLESYGHYRAGLSQIWFKREENPYEISGTITVDPNDARFLIYSVDPDSLPANTLSNFDLKIDPFTVNEPDITKKYLILDYIGPNADVWGELTANRNDIIEYSGGAWRVYFDSEMANADQFAVSNYDSKQYRYDIKTHEWGFSYEGYYDGGDFSVVL
jgi:hypothetical protein